MKTYNFYVSSLRVQPIFSANEAHLSGAGQFQFYGTLKRIKTCFNNVLGDVKSVLGIERVNRWECKIYETRQKLSLTKIFHF